MSLNNQISDWLDDQLENPYDGPLPEKWKRFFIQEEYEFKTLPEALYEFLGDEGYTNATLSERYSKWIDETFIHPVVEE